jgi:hypothetical protein
VRRCASAIRFDDLCAVENVEPQQHSNECRRDTETNGDMRYVEADKLGHGKPPLCMV